MVSQTLRALVIGCLALSCTALFAAPAVAQDVIDIFGKDRLRCAELAEFEKIEESFDCLQSLWSDHAEEMSPSGQVEVLRQMGELYSVVGSPGEAVACYRAILGIDPHWLPENFDALPTSWRDPIMAAYRDRGFLSRSAGLHNVALLDFEVVDLSKDEVDLTAISKALPSYISSYLQEAMDGATIKGEATPMKLVSYRERSLLMGELAASSGLEPGADITVDAISTANLVQAGKVQAVQGFLSGTVIREPGGKVNIAMRLLSVETGQITCPVTKRGKAKNLFPMLQDALGDWLGCAVEGATLPEGRGTDDLGPMAQGVRALEHFHNALALAEEENFGQALVQARAAVEMRPGNYEFLLLVDNLEAQADRVDVVQNVELPPARIGEE